MSQKKHPLELDGWSPDDLDVIPELAEILARVQLPNSSTTIGGTPVATAVTGTTPLATTSGGALAPAPAPISLRDFPAATDHVRHKLQRARAGVKSMPDMNRTIEEQEEEIAELEERIRQQREVLNNIKQMGLQFIEEQKHRKKTKGA